MSNKILTNTENLQFLLGILQNKAAGSGDSGGIEWISCSTLPTTYISEPGEPGRVQLYYLALPSENCCVLFYNSSGFNGITTGTYDVKNCSESPLLSNLLSDEGSSFGIVQDVDDIYLSISTSAFRTNTYYAIIPLMQD